MMSCFQTTRIMTSCHTGSVQLNSLRHNVSLTKQHQKLLSSPPLNEILKLVGFFLILILAYKCMRQGTREHPPPPRMKSNHLKESATGP